MPSPINWDEQKRQQEYRNWKASQEALNQMPRGVKTKGDGRKDRKALISAIAMIAGIFLCLVVLSLLTGCVAPQLEQKIPAVYNAEIYDLSLPESMSYELEGNGTITVALPFYNRGDPVNNVAGGTEVYALSVQGQTVTGQRIIELEQPARLLGVDVEDGIWVYDEAIRRFDKTGGILLTIQPPHPLLQDGMFGFADDGTYTYLLCWFRDPDESWILIYDRQGALAFSQELTEYCQNTLGYIPREEEWAEELEGREEDLLLTMLFPEGPTDSVMLTTLQDGTAAVALIRQSPVDSERYCILCAIQNDFSITPVMYYQVDGDGGIPYGLPMASPEDRYDLLSPQKDALYGIDMEAGTLSPLADWIQLGTSPSWFTGWANSVSVGPDGRVWSMEFSKKQNAEIIRAVGPIQ